MRATSRKWPTVALGDVAVIDRTVVAPSEFGGFTSYVGLENINADGTIIASDPAITELKSAKFAFSPKHVLFGKLRPYLRKVARPDFPGICSTDILPILPLATRIDRNYLFHCLRSEGLIAKATLFSQGANLPRVSPRSLQRLEVPLPPLAEQRRVAAALDKADDLQRRQHARSRMVDELLRSVFLDLFGDPFVRNGSWELVRLEEIVTDVQYGTSERANTDRRGLPVLRMNNIARDGSIDLTDLKWCELAERDFAKFTVRRGDLLFNRTNSPDLVGKTGVWNRDDVAAFAGYLIRVRFDEDRVLPQFVSACLNSTSGKSLLRTIAKSSINMANINATQLQQIAVALPPLELQRKYASFELAAGEIIDKGRLARRDAASLSLSLSERLLAGEAARSAKKFTRFQR